MEKQTDVPDRAVSDHTCVLPEGVPDPEEVSTEDDLLPLEPEHPVSQRLDHIVASLDGLTHGMDGMMRGFQEFRRESELRSATAAQQSHATELHWETHIIDPMVNQLFPVYDLALAYRCAHQRSGHDRSSAAFKAVQDMLQGFLGTYGIDVFLSKPGAAFDASCMMAVKVERTAEGCRDRYVRKCLRAGFRRGERVLRPAHVVLVQHDKFIQLQDPSDKERPRQS